MLLPLSRNSKAEHLSHPDPHELDSRPSKVLSSCCLVRAEVVPEGFDGILVLATLRKSE